MMRATLSTMQVTATQAVLLSTPCRLLFLLLDVFPGICLRMEVCQFVVLGNHQSSRRSWGELSVQHIHNLVVFLIATP